MIQTLSPPAGSPEKSGEQLCGSAEVSLDDLMARAMKGDFSAISMLRDLVTSNGDVMPPDRLALALQALRITTQD